MQCACDYAAGWVPQVFPLQESHSITGAVGIDLDVSLRLGRALRTGGTATVGRHDRRSVIKFNGNL